MACLVQSVFRTLSSGVSTFNRDQLPRYLDKFVNPIWKDHFVDEITPADVHEMIFTHLKNVSDLTRLNYLKTIKRFFSAAIEEGLLLRNPALGIKVKKHESVKGVLNKTEIDTLLMSAHNLNHRFFHHWSVALLTGMRSGELYALRWTDAAFEPGLIHVTKSWSKLNGEGPTKSGKNRIVPMSNECKRFLAELKLKALDHEFVLPRLNEWERGMAARVLRDFCEGIGITPISFHDLRATFITQLLGNGVSLAKVMTIVGHSELKTTQGYLRMCGRDVIGATEELRIEIPRGSTEVSNVFDFRRSE